MSRARSLISDTVVLAFGTLGGRVIGILLLPLYTYCLTRAEFGTVELIVTSIDLVLPLIFLTISEAVLRFAMTRGERKGDVLRTGMTFVGGGTCFVVLAAAVFCVWVPVVQVSLVASIIVVQAVNLVLGAWARAIDQVLTYAVSGLFQAATIGLANVAFLLVLDLGVPGFLLSLLVGYVVSAVLLMIRMPVVATVRASSFDLALLRRMLLFSAPLVPNVVLWWVTNISGRFFLAASHGLDEVGLFGVASRFPAIVTMATTVFAQAWQLSANRSVDDEDDDQGAFYSGVFRFYSAVLILGVSSLVLVIKPLMRLAASAEFFDAWQAVPPLLVGAMFAAFASFYGAIYTAARRSSGVLKTTVAAGLASLVLNALLIPRFGLIGAALSLALCFLGLWTLRIFDSQSITRTSVSPRLLIPGLALLLIQISAQYSALPAGWAYGVMAAIWLALLVLFRREIGEAISRVRATLSRPRTPGAE